MNSTRSRVSVVILTYNRREEVLRTLGRLSALEERPPLILVDNASQDGTADAVAEQFPDVVLLRRRTNIGAAARNDGVEAVCTPYVAFADDDTWWEPGSLTLAADLLDRHPQVGVLCARILVGESQETDPISELMADSPLDSDGLPGNALLGFIAGASVLRVSAFRQCGGYSPRFFLGGEEELLALDFAANGWKIVYVPQLEVHHHPSDIRNAKQRRWLMARNAIWVSWLRLPFSAAARRTLSSLWSSRGQALRVATEVAKGLPWLLAHRDVIPQEVEVMRRQLS